MDFLEKCLSSALEAANQFDPSCSIVCVDNISTDKSVTYIRSEFPEIELIVSSKNDFLFSLNAVVKQRSEDVVIVLNNDMHFNKKFIKPLLSHLEDKTVFAVGSSIFDWDGKAQTIGPRYGQIKKFWFYKWFDCKKQETSFSLEACGGASAYRREMFLELKGFDPLYRPGYFEDFDLSYRAWQRGWKSIYEPRSIVYHKVSASMVKEYGVDRKTRIHFRNYVLFMTKNIGNWFFLIGFLFLLPYRGFSNLLRGNRTIFWSVVDSLPRIPQAIYFRFRRTSPEYSTAEILAAVVKDIS